MGNNNIHFLRGVLYGDLAGSEAPDVQKANEKNE
jgi:hypothetical protein